MKNWMYILIIIVLVGVVGNFVISGDNKVTGNSVNEITGNPQKVNIGMKNYNYYPDTIRVKANQPVEITLDDSVYGCFRAFTIRDLGVSKYTQNPSDKIIFTPTEKGTFRFSCSMGMGVGTIIVE